MATKEQTFIALAGDNWSCRGCVHREICAAPCKPVSLALDNIAALNLEIETEKELQYFSRKSSKEFLWSELDIEQVSTFCNENTDELFKDTGENFKLTQIFIDRFFRNLSMMDIANKYDITHTQAVGFYSRSLKRVRSLIENMNSNYQGSHFVESHPEISVDDKAFILNKIFGINRAEIAKLENVSKNIIDKRVQRSTLKIQSVLEPAQALAELKKQADLRRNQRQKKAA